MGWFIVVGYSRSGGIVLAYLYKGTSFLCKVGSMDDQSRKKVEKYNDGTTFMKYVKNSSDNCTKEIDVGI